LLLRSYFVDLVQDVYNHHQIKHKDKNFLFTNLNQSIMAGADETPPANPSQRVFYSATSATGFLTDLTATLAKQQKTTLEALREQEAFLQQINASITTLTASLQEVLREKRQNGQSPSQSPKPSPTDEVEERRRSPTRGLTPGIIPSRSTSPLPPATPEEDEKSPAIRIRSATRETTASSNDPASTSQQPNSGPSARVPGIKLTKFYGDESENVLAWLHSVKQFFKLNGVTNDHKVAVASNALRRGAKSFFHYLVVNSGYKDPPWPVFEQELIAKYENMAVRADLLRDKLQNIRYHGVSKMAEYCEEFRSIESQIYDMAFPDRLLNFSRPIPAELAMHLRNSDLRSKDMEVVYQLTRQWAISAVTSRALQSSGHHHHRSKHREGKSLFQFRKKNKRSGRPTSKKKDHDSDSDDSVTERLDKMERKLETIELFNRMDIQSVVCYNCRQRGHFAADCKLPRKVPPSKTTPSYHIHQRERKIIISNRE
jgi:hypothetical protein